MLNLFPCLLISQFVFAKTLGGTGGDLAWSITRMPSGACVIAGSTTSFGAGYGDFLVLKLNPDGSIAWSRTFGGTNDDVPCSIIQTTDGGFAVAGYTGSFGAGLDDLLVLKLNSDGSLAWARTYGGMSYDFASSIIQTTDGGFAVAGYTESFGTGNWDPLVLKLNSDGSLAWARTFGGTSRDYVRSIVQTTDGGFAVAGYTDSFGSGGYDILVLRLNSNGSLSWARAFGRDSGDYALSIVQATDGGFAVAGYTNSFGAGNSDFLVLKVNSDGSLGWALTFGGTGDDYAFSITQATDGGLSVAGYTESFGSGLTDFLILKLYSYGSLVWAGTFGGTNYDRAYSITQASDGRYVIAGSTQSFGAGSDDLLVLKLNSDGSYPGCVQNCSLTAYSVTPYTSSPSVGATCYPSTSSPNLTTGTPNLAMSDICTPAVEERDMVIKPWVTCSPVPGGALFMSPYDIGVKIYKADGRLAYSGELHEGENQIPLEPGVYFWRARDVGAGPRACPSYRGKIAIR